MDLATLLESDLLPEEIQGEINLRKQAREARQETIASVIRKKRDEAVKARKACGIEHEWSTCEEQYEGIDDANRNDIRALKPANPDGVVTTSVIPQPARSTVFLNITRPYTDAAASRIADMLLPTDDRNWALRPTALPELSKKLDDLTLIPGAGATTEPMPQPAGAPVTPPAPGEAPAPPRQLTVADIAKDVIERANTQAAAAEKRIDDWLMQCQFHTSVRALILECAKLGTGVLKGPTPTRRRAKKVLNEGGEVRVEMTSSIDPESKQVSVWNVFPDPSCGGNIHNGSYICEKDDISYSRLQDLRNIPGYSVERIDQILKEGPARKYHEDVRAPSMASDEDFTKSTFEIWYFYGDLDRNDFEMMNMKADDLDPLFQDDLFAACGKSLPVLVTMVNDTPIKVARNPLDSGEFPYDFIVWQERANSPYGYGVPYQIRTPQGMANAGTRNLMDNAGLAGGPILVVDQSMLEPADGSWTICPRKVFTTLEGAVGRDVRQAITAIDIPMFQADLMAIVQFALKMAEDVTGLPMLLQGQLGKAPDTVGGMQMLQNNASSVVRRLAKLFDDRITEPHIGRYYEWLLLYGPRDDEKGDFHIDARGSSALVERDIQNQTIATMLQLSINPAFGLSPARCMEEFLKSQRLDVKRFQPSDDEKAAMAQQQPAPPPQVMAAQIREQGAMQRAQLEAQVDAARVKADTDRDTAYIQAETQRTQVEHDARMAELNLKLQLAQLDYANRNETTLAQIKADLAQTSAKLNLQRELAQTPPAGSPEVTKPPVEPAGRAPKGLAYSR